MTQAVEGKKFDPTIQEQYRKTLNASMEANHVNVKTLSTVSKISANLISSMRSGKYPISTKSMDRLNTAIQRIVEERTGISDAPVIKHEPVKEEPKKSKLALPEYFLQHLQVRGNTVIGKQYVGSDTEAFLKGLRDEGFDCVLKKDRDEDWIVTVKPPVSDEIVVVHSVVGAIEEKPQVVWQVNELKNPGEKMLAAIKAETMTPDVEEKKPATNARPKADLVAFIETEIQRNVAVLENADMVGQEVIKRLSARQPLLEAILESLKAPEPTPIKKVDPLLIKRLHVLSAEILTVAESLAQE